MCSLFIKCVHVSACLIALLFIIALLITHVHTHIQTHTKWQQRKEALETLLKLTGNPKLEPGEYGELMRMLKKVQCSHYNAIMYLLLVYTYVRRLSVRILM